MKDYAVWLTEPGDISRFRILEQAPAHPGPGEVRIRQQAIGTNFLDVYHRTGLYALPAYPAVIGVEAAGVIEAIGPGVEEFREGDRVAYAGPPVGAYVSARTMPADRVIKLPDTVSVTTAASSLLKGMTAFMLLTETFPVGKGTTVLIHAAAGGLGSLLVPWAKSLDAVVIGTVSTSEKAVIATSLGADYLVVGRDADLVEAVQKLTKGRGVDVAYDGIGGSMLAKSLRAVRPFGMVATIGQAAGPPPPVPVDALRPGKTLTHPSIMAWVSDPKRYRDAASAALSAMERGLVAQVAAEYPLSDVAKAHDDMESGRRAGSILLIPQG
jgi:NADPH2:quinone reductase